jgi:hypothetical protein
MVRMRAESAASVSAAGELPEGCTVFDVFVPACPLVHAVANRATATTALVGLTAAP